MSNTMSVLWTWLFFYCSRNNDKKSSVQVTTNVGFALNIFSPQLVEPIDAGPMDSGNRTSLFRLL